MNGWTRRAGLGALVAALAGALGAGCYDPGFARCTIACAPDGDACPGDMTCSNGLCAPEGDSCVDTTTPTHRTLAAGAHHVCTIREGHIYCWGDNSRGQLALPTTTAAAEPTEVTPPTTGAGQWIALAAGDYHTCAQHRPDTPGGGDEIVCWGDASASQLGNQQASAGFAGPMLAGVTWEAIGAGGAHSCAIGRAAAGDLGVYCWGEDAAGQLDGVPGAPRAEPALVALAAADWRAVDGGARHTCATATDGQAACWGDNAAGQLGTPEPGAAPRSPGAFARVDAGGDETCAIRRDGTLACWGDNRGGRLGVGTTDPQVETPTAVEASGATDGWTAIDVNVVGACGVRDRGVYCWSDDPLGVGLGGLGTAQLAPATAVVGGSAAATQVAVLATGACARDAPGAVACWGDSPFHELGDGTVTTQRAPVEVASPVAGAPWISVEAGEHHTCGVVRTATGPDRYATYCFGLSANGQAGPSSATQANATPTALDGAGTATRDVALGDHHTCTVSPQAASQAAVQCWGDDSRHQLLGGGAVAILDNAANPAITADGDYTCVTGSTLHVPTCWGTPLPDGSHASSTAMPVAPSPPLQESTVRWGASSGCGIQNAGTAVYCFGSEAMGELGNGAAGDPSWPASVAVIGVPAAVTFLGGGPGRTRCAGQVNGSVYCWGDNTYGQVLPGAPGGMADTAMQTLPPGVPSLTSVLALATGGTHGCAISSAASLWCWGGFDRGQRANATAATVAQIPNPSGIGAWTAVSPGDQHTCAIGEGTRLYCWGSNTFGQLGAGLATARPSAGPVDLPL